MVSRTDFGFYLATERGDLKPKDYEGIVELNNQEDFAIVLENKSALKVKAECHVSGEYIGTIVIGSGERKVIRRPLIGIDRHFRYAAFGSKSAIEGGLYHGKLHGDEVTVIFLPEDLRFSERRYFATAGDASCKDDMSGENFYGTACGHNDYVAPRASAGENISGALSACANNTDNYSQSATLLKGLKVGCDNISSRGGGVLGPNKTFQHFTRVSDFKTKGEFYFTIIMRTRCPTLIPDIIPISDMRKYHSL